MTSLLIDTDIHPVVDSASVEARLPQPWRTRYAGGNRGPGTLGWWNPMGVDRSDVRMEDGRSVHSDPDLMVEHFFDAYEIDYGIFIPGGILHTAQSPEPDFGAAVISAVNDSIVEEWLPRSSRFRTSMGVYPHLPELAVAEIHRIGSHPQIVQVQLPSGSRIPLGQRIFHPIYDAACEHGLTIAIHPGSEGVGLSGQPNAAGYPTSYFEWHTTLVNSYIAHLTSMLCEGVFAKFPTLKFVLVEGGISWLPPILWRMDKNWKALHSTIPWLNELPSEVAARHIRLSTQPLEEPPNLDHFHAMLEMFPAEQMLMFSSDFPHWDGDAPDFAVRQFPEQMRPRIMGQTAAELYNLA
ncbi:MAG: amidohydrolase family protein [Caldilineaceae bacterium]|nr:amidohydrolase family protein [Caldilineaceae bacterium]